MPVASRTASLHLVLIEMEITRRLSIHGIQPRKRGFDPGSGFGKF